MKKFGRPSKYKKIYAKKLIKHFDIEPTRTILEKFYYKNGDIKEKEVEVANELPTIIGFAREIGVTDDTLVRWSKRYKDFSAAYRWAKSLQERIWMVNSLKGLYNPYFAALMGKNIYNWKDKTETDTKHTGTVVIRKVGYRDLLKQAKENHGK